MKLEKVNIDNIRMYENNAKEHPDWQIEQIKNSIQEFGYNDPIAIDENNTIIEGHGRYLALKELGYAGIEVIRLNNLTEEQKTAYAIVHNKLTMNTEFNIDKLKYELNKLEIAEFDLNLLGFNDYELENIMDTEEVDLDEFFQEEEQEKKEEKIKVCPHCGKEI